MGVISRGLKNAFRNNIRTISIVLILSISIAMALIMLLALKTVQGKIDSVKSSIGNYISVSPAGIRGFEGGGNLLTSDNVTTIKSVPNVKKVVLTLSDRLTNGTNTNLTSPIEPGSFGNRARQQESQDQGSNSNSSRNQPTNFTMPVMVTGTNDLSTTANLEVSTFTIISGEKFNESSSDLVALVGKDLASKNNLSVGSTFTAYNQTIQVIGIFDGGNTFANAGLVMPLTTVQNLSNQAGQISGVIVEANSIDEISQVTSDIKTKLGNAADVISQQDSSNNAIAPLENIKKISLYSLVGALIAGSVIIFLTMVMIVRERRREIGVLKAIGASNILVVTQFAIESLALTLISAIVGTILGSFLSNPVLNVLVSNSESSLQNSARGGGPSGGAFARFAGGIGQGAGAALRNLHSVVDWKIILYGLAAAIIIAILGSAIPAFIIAKIRPAEVLRSE